MCATLAKLHQATVAAACMVPSHTPVKHGISHMAHRYGRFLHLFFCPLTNDSRGRGACKVWVPRCSWKVLNCIYYTATILAHSQNCTCQHGIAPLIASILTCFFHTSKPVHPAGPVPESTSMHEPACIYVANDANEAC